MEKDLKQVNVESARIFNTFLVVAGCCTIIFALVAGFSTVNSMKKVDASNANKVEVGEETPAIVTLPKGAKLKDKTHFKLIAIDTKKNLSYYMYVED